MADVAVSPAQSRHFFVRRLHSLTGIVPVGAFLFMHLVTNASVTFNTPERDFFQEQVNRIHGLGPLLVTVEILFIFLPLAFHAGLGVKIWLEGKPNALSYPLWGNLRYTLQRVTGVIALVFILVHLWHMHWLGGYFGGGYFDPHDATRTAAGAMQFSRWWAWPLYYLGVSAAVFHFANGIWTFLITWGVTLGRESQRKVGYACAVFGIALALAGFAAVQGLMRHPNPKLPEKPYTPDRIDEPAAAVEEPTATG